MPNKRREEKRGHKESPSQKTKNTFSPNSAPSWPTLTTPEYYYSMEVMTILYSGSTEIIQKLENEEKFIESQKLQSNGTQKVDMCRIQNMVEKHTKTPKLPSPKKTGIDLSFIPQATVGQTQVTALRNVDIVEDSSPEKISKNAHQSHTQNKKKTVRKRLASIYCKQRSKKTRTKLSPYTSAF